MLAVPAWLVARENKFFFGRIKAYIADVLMRGEYAKKERWISAGLPGRGFPVFVTKRRRLIFLSCPDVFG